MLIDILAFDEKVGSGMTLFAKESSVIVSKIPTGNDGLKM